MGQQAIKDQAVALIEGDTVDLYNNMGAACKGIVRGIADADKPVLTVEILGTDSQPTGTTVIRLPLEVTKAILAPDTADPVEPAEQEDAEAAKSAPEFALPEKKDRPAKFPLGDKGQIEGAITCVVTGQYRGNDIKPPLSADEKAEAVRNIEKAIAASGESDDWKKQELARLHGKSEDSKKSAGLVPVRERNIACKAISEDGWRVGGYLVLWGSEKLTDITGDWFTKSTDFKLGWYDKRPFLYEHGADGEIKTTAVGTIDTLEPDEDGLWMEAQLERSQRYAKLVRDMVKTGKLGLSSGSLPHLVSRKNNARRGEIIEWPIGEGSGTVTPAEPRTIDVTLKHYIGADLLETAYKSIGVLADKWLEEPADQETTREQRQDSANGSHGAGENASTSDTTETKTEPQPPTEETMELTPEQIMQIAAAVAKAMPVVAPPPAPEPAPAPTKALPANGNGALPTPAAPVETKAAPVPTMRVIGDRRFVDMTAEDMSFFTEMYAGVMDRLIMKQQSKFGSYELKPLEAAAKSFFEELQHDPDHKLQRLISDKVLRGIAENRLDSNLTEFIPFSTKSAVDGNHYDPSAVKFAREERLVSRLTDQGKTTSEIKSALKDMAIKSNELDSTGQTGFGVEWVPTIWNSDAWRRIRVNNVIAGTVTTVQMPSNPWNWPLESTDPTVFYVAEGTDAAQLVLGSGNTLALSKAGTGKVAFTAKKLGAHIGFSVEENEDSIIPIIPIWKYQVTRALQNYVDDTAINGDTVVTASTNINLIDGTPAAGTSYLAFDGMRKYGLLTNTAQLVDFGNVAPTMANFRLMQTKLLTAYQADFQNLIYVINVATWQKMKAMPEFSAYLNSGVPPTGVTGLLPGGSPNLAGVASLGQPPMPVGYIDGIPVYVSAQIGLAKSGAIGSNGGEISTTGSNNVTGTALLFHRSRVVIGFRRAITTDVLATGVFSDTMQLWGTVRLALNFFDTQSVAVGYDIGN